MSARHEPDSLISIVIPRSLTRTSALRCERAEQSIDVAGRSDLRAISTRRQIRSLHGERDELRLASSPCELAVHELDLVQLAAFPLGLPQVAADEASFASGVDSRLDDAEVRAPKVAVSERRLVEACVAQVGVAEHARGDGGLRPHRAHELFAAREK